MTIPMRDFAVLTYFVVLIAISFGRPRLGLALWVWTALATPNALTYGFADAVRYNLIAAVFTLAMCLVFRRPTPVRPHSSVYFAILFLAWTFISTIFAIHDSPSLSRVQGDWLRGAMLFFVALLIVYRRSDFTLIAWAIVLALGLYSGIEGLKYIATAGGHKIVGPANSNLRDNNHLALAINMMLPFAILLLRDLRSKALRLAMLAFLCTSVLAVFGTNSRGGFAGLAILLIAWILLSPRKLVMIPTMTVAAILAFTFAPQTYKDRVGTISNATAEGSFASRMMTWKQSALIALDNPLTGGGFHAVQQPEIWGRYALEFDRLDFIDTPHADQYSHKAAHSIYFEVLGDHGFVGLALFLSCFALAGLKALSLTRLKSVDEQDAWIPNVALCCLLSLLTFAVSGALLSMAYFELAWLVVALVSALAAAADRRRRTSTDVDLRPAVPGQQMNC